MNRAYTVCSHEDYIASLLSTLICVVLWLLDPADSNEVKDFFRGMRQAIERLAIKSYDRNCTEILCTLIFTSFFFHLCVHY